ncbi:hypothetical protein JHK86_004989 [Glycine max]|nr:hypothetical protein JHK86_004989 [Glycine max]
MFPHLLLFPSCSASPSILHSVLCLAPSSTNYLSNNLETSRSALCQRYALIKPLDSNSERKLWYIHYVVNISVVQACELWLALKSKNIEFVVAPYEADGQLAHMSQLGVKNGGVAAMITEDSDLIAYDYPTDQHKSWWFLQLSGNIKYLRLANSRLPCVTLGIPEIENKNSPEDSLLMEWKTAIDYYFKSVVSVLLLQQTCMPQSTHRCNS